MPSLLMCLQLESLPAMVQGVWTADPKAQLEATSQFRKLLSIGEWCSRLWSCSRAIGMHLRVSEPEATPALVQSATRLSRRSSAKA